MLIYILRALGGNFHISGTYFMCEVLSGISSFSRPISPRSCNSIRLNDPSLSIYRHPTTLVFISDPRIMVFPLEKPSLLFALFRWGKKTITPLFQPTRLLSLEGTYTLTGINMGLGVVQNVCMSNNTLAAVFTSDTNTFKHRGITHWKTNL